MLYHKELPIGSHLRFYGGVIEVVLTTDQHKKPRLTVEAPKDVFVTKTKTYQQAGGKLDVSSTGVHWNPGEGVMHGRRHRISDEEDRQRGDKDRQKYDYPCNEKEGLVLDWDILLLVNGHVLAKDDVVTGARLTIDAPGDADCQNGNSSV
jgi:hypothetical protein